MHRVRRGLATAAIAAGLIGMSFGAASAQPAWSDKTTITFDEPVIVPGATLQAGTYTFKLADSLTNRQIVQIWNEDQTKLFTTTIAIPTRRNEPKGDIYVKFQRTAEGTPPAVKAWFYPGTTTGHMFVYPEEQAKQIAKGNKTLVLSSDDDPKAGNVKNLFTMDDQGRKTAYTETEPPNVEAAPWDNARLPDEAEERAEQRVRQQDSSASRSQGAAGVGSANQQSAASSGADTQRSGMMTGQQAGPQQGDAREHLDRAEKVLMIVLRPAHQGTAQGEPRAVGTAGTTASDAKGTVTVERQQLEEIRMHLRQARAALDRLHQQHTPQQK